MKQLILFLYLFGFCCLPLSANEVTFSLRFAFLEVDSDRIERSGLQDYLRKPELGRSAYYEEIKRFVSENKSTAGIYLEGVIDEIIPGTDRVLDLISSSEIKDSILSRLNPLLNYKIARVDLEGIDAELSFEVKFTFLDLKAIEEGLAVGLNYDNSDLPRRLYGLRGYIYPLPSGGRRFLHYGLFSGIDDKAAIILLESSK